MSKQSLIDIVEGLRPSTSQKIAAIESAKVPSFFDLKAKQATVYYLNEIAQCPKPNELLIEVSNIEFRTLYNRRTKLSFKDSMINFVNNKEIDPFLLFIDGLFIKWSSITIINDINKQYLLIKDPISKKLTTDDTGIYISSITALKIPYDVKYTEGEPSTEGYSELFAFSEDGLLDYDNSKYKIKINKPLYLMEQVHIRLENLMETIPIEYQLNPENIFLFKNGKIDTTAITNIAICPGNLLNIEDLKDYNQYHAIVIYDTRVAKPTHNYLTFKDSNKMINNIRNFYANPDSSSYMNTLLEPFDFGIDNEFNIEKDIKFVNNYNDRLLNKIYDYKNPIKILNYTGSELKSLAGEDSILRMPIQSTAEYDSDILIFVNGKIYKNQYDIKYFTNNFSVPIIDIEDNDNIEILFIRYPYKEEYTTIIPLYGDIPTGKDLKIYSKNISNQTYTFDNYNDISLESLNISIKSGQGYFIVEDNMLTINTASVFIPCTGDIKVNAYFLNTTPSIYIDDNLYDLILNNGELSYEGYIRNGITISSNNCIAIFNTFSKKQENEYIQYPVISETYRFINGSWTSRNQMNTARYALSGCGNTRSALAFNGRNSALLTLIELFNGNNWTLAQNSPIAKIFSAGCGVSNNALSIGGANLNTVINSTEKFNGSSWSILGSNMNIPRSRHAACGTSESVIVICGANASNNVLVSCELYNGITWSESANRINNAQYLAACGSTNSALAFGGRSGNNSIKITEVYNSTTWSVVSDLPNNIELLSGCGVSNNALTIGGIGTNSTHTNIFNGVSWYNSQGYLANQKNSLAGCGDVSSALSFGGTLGNTIYSNTEIFNGQENNNEFELIDWNLYDKPITVTFDNQYKSASYIIQEDTVKLKLPVDFKYCRDINKYLVFVDGIKINREDYRIIMPTPETPINDISIYSNIPFRAGSYVNIIYLPFKYEELLLNPVEDENGNIIISKDYISYNLSKDLYLFFINGIKVNKEDIIDKESDKVYIIKRPDKLENISILKYIEEDSDLVALNPDKTNSLLEASINSMTDEEFKELMDFDITKISPNPVYEDLIGDKVSDNAIIEKIIRDYWLRTGAETTGKVFNYNYEEIPEDKEIDSDGNMILTVMDANEKDSVE